MIGQFLDEPDIARQVGHFAQRDRVRLLAGRPRPIAPRPPRHRLGPQLAAQRGHAAQTREHAVEVHVAQTIERALIADDHDPTLRAAPDALRSRTFGGVPIGAVTCDGVDRAAFPPLLHVVETG